MEEKILNIELINKLINKEGLFNVGEREDFLYKNSNQNIWNLTLIRDEDIYSPFIFALEGRKVGTNETWSRRYTDIKEALLHIVNDFNENASIKNKYSDVKINWKGDIPINLCLSSMDLCTIFSNLISNAFEAACQADKKEVDVSIKVIETKLLIVVSNYTKEKPDIIDGKIKSSKKEKNHGYGIKNIKKCVENNEGDFNITFVDNIFTAEVFFNDILTYK